MRHFEQKNSPVINQSLNLGLGHGLNQVLLQRYSKLLFMMMTALLFSLIALGNIVSYQYNWSDVQHVLAMDTIANSADQWRAIKSTRLQSWAFGFIIVWEIFTALICWIGAWRLWQNRHQETAVFQQAKTMSLLGITMAICLYFFGFICIASEWFLMWQSHQYNAQSSALLFSILFFLLFFVVNQAE